MPPQETVTFANTMTSGNPVSALTPRKLLKDFVADALISLPASLVLAGVSALPTSSAGLIVAINAIFIPVAGAAYRALLRWAQSPD